jgi:protocatechuate 3,4-dioxygenase alpha subunit
MNHLFTRIYFEDEPTTAADPILRRVPEARRTTLIARAVSAGSLTRRYRFDIVLQGADETVFFDFKAPDR